MTRVLLLLLLLVGGTVGCSSPEAQLCSKQQQCNVLGSQTESQCASSADACMSLLRQGANACTQLADAVDAMDSCEASLSCEEIQSTITVTGCETQIKAFANALGDAVIAGCPSCVPTDAGS